ncbi:MAG: hypothetical protein ACFFDT_28295 [Candidatus Hodarchaeota archaeon]
MNNMVWRIFKPWTWFQRKNRKPIKDPTREKPELVASRKIGDPVIDDKVKIIPYGRRIKKTPVFACVINGPSHELIKAKIVNDWWIKFRTADRKKHEKLIGDAPATFEYSSGWGLFKQRRRALVFYVGYNAEATHNPGRCDYDLPVIEGIVKMAKAITKTDVLKAAAEQVKIKSGFWEMFPYIIIVLIVFLFLFAFQIQPNM